MNILKPLFLVFFSFVIIFTLFQYSQTNILMMSILFSVMSLFAIYSGVRSVITKKFDSAIATHPIHIRGRVAQLCGALMLFDGIFFLCVSMLIFFTTSRYLSFIYSNYFLSALIILHVIVSFLCVPNKQKSQNVLSRKQHHKRTR